MKMKAFSILIALIECLSQSQGIFQEFSHCCGNRAGGWSIYLMGNLKKK